MLKACAGTTMMCNVAIVASPGCSQQVCGALSPGYALPHAAATLQSPEFYTWIRKTYMWHQLGQAVFFFLWGGIPFLVWCVQGSKGWGLPWGGHCQWAGLLPADRNDAAHSAGGSSCHLALCQHISLPCSICSAFGFAKCSSHNVMTKSLISNRSPAVCCRGFVIRILLTMHVSVEQRQQQMQAGASAAVNTIMFAFLARGISVTQCKARTEKLHILVTPQCAIRPLLAQMTWLVNSVVHVWGSKDYESGDSSRNNALVALLVFGDGWHNNHHAHEVCQQKIVSTAMLGTVQGYKLLLLTGLSQATTCSQSISQAAKSLPSLTPALLLAHLQYSAAHGLEWWQVDFSYYVIRALEVAGLAWDVKRPSEEQKRKLAVRKA